MTAEPASYFLRPRPLQNPTARLLAFPFAGGAAVAYHPWAALLPETVELVAIQYPGRGRLVQQPPCRRMEDLLDAIYPAIRSLPRTPTCFFGHSMGATVCFEIVHRLRADGLELPRALILSGRAGPDPTRSSNNWHLLPDDAFQERMRAFGGMREEILSSPEMLAYASRIIRADLTVLETWRPPARAPLDIPIVAIGGADDPDVKPEWLQLWERQTTNKFQAHVLPGGHFYFQAQLPTVISLIRQTLAGLMSSGKADPHAFR